MRELTQMEMDVVGGGYDSGAGMDPLLGSRFELSSFGSWLTAGYVPPTDAQIAANLEKYQQCSANANGSFQEEYNCRIAYAVTTYAQRDPSTACSIIGFLNDASGAVCNAGAYANLGALIARDTVKVGTSSDL